MTSATAAADTGDLDLAGFPLEVAAPPDPLAPQEVTLDDVRARIDWDAVTLGGRHPELAAEVERLLIPVIHKASGPMPPTAQLSWSVAIRLVDGAVLRHRRQPRFSGPIMAQLRKQLARLLQAGIIEYVPDGVKIRCNNMILMVPKPHTADEWRLVVDLSGLNAVSVSDEICTLPKDLLALMQVFSGCAMFSSADLRDAYYMMALEQASRELTVITDPDSGRRLWFTRAVMGGKQMGIAMHKRASQTTDDAPAPDTVTKKSVADDILMGTRHATVLSPKHATPHHQLVRDSIAVAVSVLNAFFAVGGRIKLSKCFFLSRVGQLVGFVTDGRTVAHEPSRLEHFRALQPPDNLRAARRFLGLVNAYSRNLPPSASDSRSRLQRFVAAAKWPGDGLPRALEDVCIYLRDTIVDNVPLRLIDPQSPLHVRADSNATAAGGEVGQYDEYTGDWVPLGFFHHTFTAAQRKYSVNEREFLALALTALRYCHMLRGHRVIGWVDHHNLLYLSKSENPRLLRIALMLISAGLNMSLLYEPGVRCHLSDTLSRNTVLSSSSTVDPPPVRAMPPPAASDLAFLAVSAALAAELPPVSSQPPNVAASGTVTDATADVQLAAASRATTSVTALPAPETAPATDSPASAADNTAVDLLAAAAATVTISPVPEPRPGSLSPSAYDPRAAFKSLPAVTVPGLPQNVHLAVHMVVSAQLRMPGTARSAFLKREHTAEKRLGTVPVLFLASRIYVPPSAVDIQQAYLACVHYPAHAQAHDMEERLRSAKVSWDSMSSDAKRYCRTCGYCQHVAAGTQPIPVGRMKQFLYAAPNDTLLIDFFGPLSECNRPSPFDPTGAKHPYTYIITLVDGYSRLALFLPSVQKSAAAAISAFQHWCSFYTPPRVVRVDSDRALLSDAFVAALDAVGTHLDPVPPYTHHQMGLLERTHKPFADALRRMGGHATAEWIDLLPAIIQWRNSSVNRDLGVCPHEAFFSRKPQYAYDRLGLSEVTTVTPNELANICSCVDALVQTSVAVASAQTAAQYDREREAPLPDAFAPGDTVLVYFPDRESKCLTFYRGPFEVLSRVDDDGNYYTVRDLIQKNEYEVHVERLQRFDMSRTSLAEQAQRQLPSREFGIIVAVDGHRMNEAAGLFEFCIRFYSGYRAWQLYPYVQNMTLVKEYIAEHRLDTRKKTPAQQLVRLTGRRVPGAPRPAPHKKADTEAQLLVPAPAVAPPVPSPVPAPTVVVPQPLRPRRSPRQHGCQ
jgi:hypothetical protein